MITTSIFWEAMKKLESTHTRTAANRAANRMIIEALPLSALPNAPLTLPPADVSNFDNM